MASGRSLGNSYSKASDVIYDFNCSRCFDKCSQYIKASYYCQQCDIFFCKPCLVQFACGHNVLGRGESDKWGHFVRVRWEEKCPKHKGTPIEVYCSQHDVVCCHACVLTSHKMCGSMQKISNIAKKKIKSSILDTAQNDLNDLQTKIKQLQKYRTSRLADMDIHHAQLINDLKEFRSKLNAVLDKLEKQTLKEINKMRADFADRFKSEQQLCSNMMTQMEEFRKKLTRIDNNDETLAFVRLNLCDQWAKEQTHMIADVSASTIGVLPKLVLNTQLEETLNRLHALGELVSDSNYPVKQNPLKQNKPIPVVNEPYKARALGELVSDSNSPVKQNPLEQNKPSPVVNEPYKARALGKLVTDTYSPVKQNPPEQNKPSPVVNQTYKARDTTTINIKFDDDDDVCKVTGMCQLADGSIIMSDNNNQNLKKIDNTYKIAGVHQLPVWPSSVCTTKESEVAVALANNTIQFVTVQYDMSTKYSFTTDHSCDSLSSNGNKLFAMQQGMSDVFEYDLSGSLLRTISTNTGFVCTRSVAASPDGEHLYITDRQRGLATLDKSGKLLAVFQPDDLNNTDGVCVDGLGNVFVCDCSPRNILQVSQAGNRQIAKFSFEHDGHNVLALCFDRFNMKLLVAKNRCSVVHVIHFDKI